MITNRTCRIIAFSGIALIIVNIVSYAYLLNIYPGCNDVLKAGESTSAEQMQQCQVVVATLLWNLALMALGGIMTIGGIVGFL